MIDPRDIPRIARRVWRSAILITAGLALPHTLAAQVAQSGQITGVVVASPNGDVLEGADVIAIGQGTRDLTDESGRFVLSDLASGTMMLLVRRIGFRPITVEIALAEGQQLSIISPIVLLPDPTMLDEIVAEATLDRRWRLAEFDRRRFRGIGRFVTQAQIEDRDPHRVTDMLREMAGVTMQSMRTGERFIALGRGIRPCIPSVWLNGVRVPGTVLSDDFGPSALAPGAQAGIAIGAGLQVADLNSPFWENRQPVDIDQLVSAREVSGLEVYSGLSEIPVEFHDVGNTCGAIVIWTR